MDETELTQDEVNDLLGGDERDAGWGADDEYERVRSTCQGPGHGTPGRSSAACCSAGTSPSTRRPRSSSPTPSRPRSSPPRPPGHHADARAVPPPAASRCSDPAPAPDGRELPVTTRE